MIKIQKRLLGKPFYSLCFQGTAPPGSLVKDAAWPLQRKDALWLQRKATGRRERGNYWRNYRRCRHPYILGKKAPSLGAIAAAIQQEKNSFYVTALIDHQFEIDSGPNMRGPFYFSTKVPSHIHHTSLLRIPDYWYNHFRSNHFLLWSFSFGVFIESCYNDIVKLQWHSHFFFFLCVSISNR